VRAATVALNRSPASWALLAVILHARKVEIEVLRIDRLELLASMSRVRRKAALSAPVLRAIEAAHFHARVGNESSRWAPRAELEVLHYTEQPLQGLTRVTVKLVASEQPPGIDLLRRLHLIWGHLLALRRRALEGIVLVKERAEPVADTLDAALVRAWQRVQRHCALEADLALPKRCHQSS